MMRCSTSVSVGLAAVVIRAVLFAQPPVPPAKVLAIANTTFHQIEDGPPIGANSFFVPGETIFFRCEVRGYTPSATRQVTFTYRVEPVDAAGVPLVEPRSGKVDSTLSDEDKNWIPVIRHSFEMPPFAPSGKYFVRVALKDENTGTEARTEVAFPVRGRGLKPSASLSIQNFGFYRGENDTQPLRLAVYRPGDTLWARFDLTGFKLAGKNAVNLTWGIAIADSTGRVLYRQSEPTVEKSSSFYPKSYVSCMLNLNIQPNTRPQEFVLTVTATDAVGNQTQESQNRFQVE
ncbi:MAG: hypothetical protein ACKV22_23465 [Bryobacteraceae bacterium]